MAESSLVAVANELIKMSNRPSAPRMDNSHKRRAMFSILMITPHTIIINDDGPHNLQLTITNDAERVVSTLCNVLKHPSIYDSFNKSASPVIPRILYLDTEGVWTELIHDGSIFMGFRMTDPNSTIPCEENF